MPRKRNINPIFSNGCSDFLRFSRSQKGVLYTKKRKVKLKMIMNANENSRSYFDYRERLNDENEI